MHVCTRIFFSTSLHPFLTAFQGYYGYSVQKYVI